MTSPGPDGPSLTGALVVVRRFRAGDVAAFLAYRDDPGTASLQGWDVPYLLERAEAFVTWAATAPLGVAGEWCQLAIQRRDDPGLVGDVGVHTLAPGAEPDGASSVELGVTLAPGARGAGLANEAISLVCGHLAAELGVRRAIAFVDVDNVASAALFCRLGFVLVATAAGPDGVVEHRFVLDLHLAPGRHVPR